MNLAQRENKAKAALKAAKAQLAAAEKELTVVGEIKSGDRPSPEQERRIKTQAFSFTVHFQRRKALKKVRSPGMVAKSVRRFGSTKEAEQHGRRFTKIEGHVGYKVVRVNQRANAWINWRTGKTNPVIGL